MAVFKNARIYHGEKRLDTDLTAISHSYEAETVDDTVFNDGTRSMEGGLKVLSVGYEGLYSAGTNDVDDILFNDVGSGDIPITLSASTGAAGDIAYFSRYLFTEFTNGGSVGDQHTFSGAAAAKNDPLVRGQILHEGTVTSSGNGSSVQLGTVGASQNLYGVLHVTNSGGDSSQTLDVTITGDTSSGGAFGTTHLTFSQVTTSITFGWQTKAGSISDDWFRAEWTVGGTGSPTFDIFVAAGIF